MRGWWLVVLVASVGLVYGNTCTFDDYATPYPTFKTGDSSNGYLVRYWKNAGLGHTMTVHNLALKMALEGNLTLIHSPEVFELAHVPYQDHALTEQWFGFGAGLISTESSKFRRIQSSLPSERFPPKKEEQTVPIRRHDPKGNLVKFVNAVRSNDGEPYLYTLPPLRQLGDFPDQDSVFGSTGAWYRERYERARSVGASTAAHGVTHATDSDTYRNTFAIAVHIRRGDSLRSRSRQGATGRSDIFFATLTNQLVAAVRQVAPEMRILVEVVSQPRKDARPSKSAQASQDGLALGYVGHDGQPADIRSMMHTCVDDQLCEVRYRLSPESMYSVFNGLVYADALVVASSYFSQFAAVVQRGLKFGADRFPYPVSDLPAGFAVDLGSSQEPDIERYDVTQDESGAYQWKTPRFDHTRVAAALRDYIEFKKCRPLPGGEVEMWYSGDTQSQHDEL